MTLLEQLERIETRMEQSFLQNRFDTFNQLASDRLVLLKQAQLAPENGALIELAREQTARWTEMLGKRVEQARKQRKPCGYGGRSTRSGQVVNQSL